MSASGQIVNQYIKGEERSFTIIAFPSPQIGAKYEEIFDEVMKKYTVHYDLTRIKSSDMGTLFILNYELNLAKDVSLKEFLDEIRKRNGNLDITVAKKKFASEE